MKSPKVCSHTICKNGMPFIIPVLKQALPHVDRMFITLSEKSSDGTLKDVEALAKENSKIEISYENVPNLGLLTKERQKQVDKTTEDIIWFLDDDDFWEDIDIRNCINYLHSHEDIDAISVNPYQILDKEHHDAKWVNKKYFTKFFKNVNINYRQPWPRDLIYKGDDLLYHKVNPRNQVVPYKFFHLAAVKKHSFRKDELTSFNDLAGKPIKMEVPIPKKVLDLIKF